LQNADAGQDAGGTVTIDATEFQATEVTRSVSELHAFQAMVLSTMRRDGSDKDLTKQEMPKGI
jgi:hypothetical protein